jgi:hypothetical protein
MWKEADTVIKKCPEGLGEKRKKLRRISLLVEI